MPLRRLALLCLLALAAAPACRRTSEGQTAVLLTLRTDGPVQCVALVEKGPGGEEKQEVDAAHGLPADFADARFREAALTLLVYSGNKLGEGALTLSAEGRRGSCSGPAVAKLAALAATFQQGEVVKVEGRLALLGVDKDHDGWAAPEDCNDDDPAVHPGALEICDGKDNTCTGVIDPGCACTGGARACYPLGIGDKTIGVGLCRAGVQSCVGGKWDALCAGAVVPAPERCDGLDHDCDGQAGLPSCPCKPGETRRCYTKGPAALAGVGRCAWGSQTCAASGFFGACEGDVAPLPLELCNGEDDNCNGQVDEMADAAGAPLMVRPACAKTEGVCAGAQRRCVSGSFAACTDADYTAAATKNGSTYGPDSPTCNGVDHDCDGTLDTGCTNSCPQVGATRDCYGPGLSSPTLQHAPCKKGTQTCAFTNGQRRWGACVGQVEPVAEICNGVDDDCDGAVDDLPKDEGTSCSTGRPGICGPGARKCVNGSLACVALRGPLTEECNGLDDDCDGQVDQTFDKQHDPLHCGGPNECRACATGDACCAGRCSSLQTDSLNCGACGNVCGAAQGCCAGRCVALDTSADCGACGQTCPAGDVCRQGLCRTPTETLCANGLDDDGDGKIDCADSDCAGKVCDATGGTCAKSVCTHETNCANGLDDDGDGKIDCQDPDCRGQRCQNGGVCTQADGRCVKELCTNGIDDNGDGKTDCQDAVACPPPSGGQQVCCGTAWVDVSSTVANCGACGTDCRVGHDAVCGSIACVAGKCTYGTQPDRTACPSGVCCRGACVPDKELACTDGKDDNCDGRVDCQDGFSCPPPGGATKPGCCGAAWTDLDHGDVANCGACGAACPTPSSPCEKAVCNPGGTCATRSACELSACDQAACQSGGQGGLCTDGACCTGCVDSSSHLCKPGDDPAACRSASGLCADCRTSNNPCITDACGPGGCTHTFNNNVCATASGATGRCVGGTCCVDGGACSDGGAAGTCQGGVCCLGCVESNGTCRAPAAEDKGHCGLGGVACAPCPSPGECQQEATCTAGACGFTNKPDGSSCAGGGTCSAGVCLTCASKCGGVCCDAGETCEGGQCTCAAAACAQAGGCCTQASPAQCVKASASTCSTVCSPTVTSPLEYCSSANSSAGGCVDGCSFTCGAATVTCGGPQCLVPNANGTANVCSDGVHPESCDLRLDLSTWCSCDAADKPGTCPDPKAVCLKGGVLVSSFHCVACGQSGTNGLACKGGGACVQSSGNCQ